MADSKEVKNTLEALGLKSFDNTFGSFFDHGTYAYSSNLAANVNGGNSGWSKAENIVVLYPKNDDDYRDAKESLESRKGDSESLYGLLLKNLDKEFEKKKRSTTYLYQAVSSENVLYKRYVVTKSEAEGYLNIDEDPSIGPLESFLGMDMMQSNMIAFRKWVEENSRGAKKKYKDRMQVYLSSWLEEKFPGRVGNLFRFKSADMKELLNVLRDIYEDSEYDTIDDKEYHRAPSAAISNYCKYLGLTEYWKKAISHSDPKKVVDQQKKKVTEQKIYFGAPGTGKSFIVDQITQKNDEFIFRTTFHPDYDYAQFVGSYKPCKQESLKDEITYSFIPQVFSNAYVCACLNSSEDVYLVIEELNRGNCAQIFGDIFQLLDRNENGESRYEVDTDSDFADWLENQGVINSGKLKLPSNLNILATMNTSDQSLFPMDSAFKRRFDWEYVPIKYEKDDDCGESWNADQFVIDLGLSDNNPRWLDFLEKVNDNVYDVTKSEDKQMGEFFVKPDVEKEVDGKKEKIVISLDMFKSKVLFYLWDSVYKDEVDDENAQKIFHFDYPAENGSAVTFQRLFKKKDDSLEIIKQMFKNLGVKIKDDKES